MTSMHAFMFPRYRYLVTAFKLGGTCLLVSFFLMPEVVYLYCYEFLTQGGWERHLLHELAS